MRRPNFVALALSTLLIATGLGTVLGWRPIPGGFGVLQTGLAAKLDAGRADPLAGPACSGERRVVHGGYRFLPRCHGQAPSFDRRYYVVKNAGLGTGVGLVRGGGGESLGDLAALDTGQPFVIFWSPVDHRFFANQRLGGTEGFRLFTAHAGDVSEDTRLDQAARNALLARRPCLSSDDVAVSGIRWAADGRRIALLVYARIEACGGLGNWRPLWMIGDSRTGSIEPTSIRTRHGRSPLPADGPYATL